MADYNIYIHAFSGGNDSPTTPNQMKTNSDAGGISAESGGSGGFGMARRAASFLTNPDSMIGSIIGKGVEFATSTLGITAIAATLAFSVVKKIALKNEEYYAKVIAPNSGNYNHVHEFNNIKQMINNVMHPIAAFENHYQMVQEIKRKNEANEQNMLLTGGTVINSPYGRYL